jgi:ubiquinone/menaquinone biosynthesis C-methylase UbiE
MTEELFHKAFFEIHCDLPREGPGSSESTARAFSVIKLDNSQPEILDLGCGPGKQTLDLASLCRGRITAVDSHQPFLEQLIKRASAQNVSDRIVVLNADMADLGFADESFDVVWSEAAAYSIGFDNALLLWKRLIKPGGYLAVSEVVWTSPERPAEVETFWNVEYPEMRQVDDLLEACTQSGYSIVDSFLLPESAWWEDYYTHIEGKLDDLESKYSSDAAGLEVVKQHRDEILMRRSFASAYGYLFVIMQPT